MNFSAQFVTHLDSPSSSFLLLNDCLVQTHTECQITNDQQPGIRQQQPTLIDLQLHTCRSIAPRGHCTSCNETHTTHIANRTISSRSEEHTSELQSLMRISYAVFCLKKNNTNNINITRNKTTIQEK